MAKVGPRLAPQKPRTIPNLRGVQRQAGINFCCCNGKENDLGLGPPRAIGAIVSWAEHLAHSKVPDRPVPFGDQVWQPVGKTGLQPLIRVGRQQPTGPQRLRCSDQARPAVGFVRQWGGGGPVVPGHKPMHPGADVFDQVGHQMRVMAIGKNRHHHGLTLGRLAKDFMVQHARPVAGGIRVALILPRTHFCASGRGMVDPAGAGA